MATLGLYPRDFILIASLLVMICSVAWNWDEYAGCKRPLHVWLIVDLCGILCFRVNQVCVLVYVQRGIMNVCYHSRLTNIHTHIQYLFALTASMRNRSGVLRLLPSIYAAFNLYVLYPFLWVWTAIGCVWYNQSSSCLPPEMSGWSYLAWIGIIKCVSLSVTCPFFLTIYLSIYHCSFLCTSILVFIPRGVWCGIVRHLSHASAGENVLFRRV
jgi:E3 ubiquitin-protein ligase SIS3